MITLMNVCMRKMKLRMKALWIFVLLVIGLGLMAVSRNSSPGVKEEKVCIKESVNQAIDKVEISLTTNVPSDECKSSNK